MRLAPLAHVFGCLFGPPPPPRERERRSVSSRSLVRFQNLVPIEGAFVNSTPLVKRTREEPKNARIQIFARLPTCRLGVPTNVVISAAYPTHVTRASGAEHMNSNWGSRSWGRVCFEIVERERKSALDDARFCLSSGACVGPPASRSPCGAPSSCCRLAVPRSSRQAPRPPASPPPSSRPGSPPGLAKSRGSWSSRKRRARPQAPPCSTDSRCSHPRPRSSAGRGPPCSRHGVLRVSPILVISRCDICHLSPGSRHVSGSRRSRRPLRWRRRSWRSRRASTRRG